MVQNKNEIIKRECEWCQEVKEPYGYQEGECEKTGDVKALWICRDCYHAIFGEEESE